MNALLLAAIAALLIADHALAGDIQTHAAPLVAVATADPERGERLYEARCIACHSLDANRVGPRHRGVYGREAGSLADFRYSPALAASRLVWNEDTVDRWLSDPGALVPGQRMNVRVSERQDRADLIAFLERESGG